ncbi:hypothetical protein [Sphingomonas sp. dw_22]|uniref:hypothetical protein n=1 Tax=Sphingomonas sp. dw_22 TaxID=2721175 RepID=UPI001BD4C53D|nr:hypothetical protein [Sphingomonas sp. dw_22]
MASFKRLSLILVTTCAGAALSACDGANDIASPGSGGNVIINNPPAPTPTPTPTPTLSLVTPAAGCPSVPAGANGFVDAGVTQATPIGSWRVCQLPAMVNRSITLTKIPGLIYSMNGRVDVGCDGGIVAPTAAAPRTSSTVSCTAANGITLTGGQLTADTNVTLTIEPGVIVAGYTGTSWLAVNRGNKINAVGTASQPIIFTSKDNVLGLNNDSSFGQWGGVVLMGRARVTDCTTGSVAVLPALSTCERQTEGSADAATFGGNEDAYNAGTVKYVQIRYSGYVLGANTELQALTAEGVGTGTTLEYVQSHNSSDDGMEFFGGSVRFKHYIATGADDDSLDIDTGLQGLFQYVLLLQRPGQGDALMEVDNTGFEADTPRQNTKVVNFTAVQGQVSSNNEANDLASILLRGNADLTLADGLVISPNNECLRMNGTGATPATLVARSVALQCNTAKYLGAGSISAAQVAMTFGTGTNGNNDAFTNTLTALFVNGASETALAPFDAKTLDTFFDTTTYVGAVKDATDNWYKGWTCNSGYAPFDGTGSDRSCTSLPTN